MIQGGIILTEGALRIIITGGSSGIGEAIALKMVKSNRQFCLTSPDPN